MAEDNKSSLDALSALCKRRGFIYHSSEIYGGMPGFWDYGPLGCELKNNVKQAWWQFTVRGREDVAGLDATTRYGNSCYSSFTCQNGEPVLWYPDNKRRLYGVRVRQGQ